jgi:hypothetical protein
VTAPRRQVRATREFFEKLDDLLPAARGADGTPSRSDFQSYELLHIVDLFATRWDELPRLIPGRHDYRCVIVKGQLVAVICVNGQEASDGAIELTDLEIDVHGLPDPG